MVAVEYLRKNKILKYYILVIIAYFFHSSAIILLIVPLFKYMSLTRKNIILTFVGTCILSIFIYPVMIIMGYEDNSYFLESLNRSSLPIAAIINACMDVIYLYIIYYIKKKYGILYPDNLIVWLAIINLCINIIAIPFLILARFSAYFSMYGIFILLYAIYHTPTFKKTKKIFTSRKTIFRVIVLLLIIRFSIINIYKNEWSNLYPYEFYDFKGGYRKQVHWTPDT